MIGPTSGDSPIASSPRLWAIVLAGGDGERLRPLTRFVHADDRPKQFADVDGRGTMLERTLRRVSMLVPPERTVIVTVRRQEGWIDRLLRLDPRIRIFSQPLNRGTAPAVLWPATWIAARDPLARLVLFPTDHHVRDESALAAHIRTLASRPAVNDVVLLGARASSAETSYGWIEVASRRTRNSSSLLRVRSFIEKPTPTLALACLLRGDLWNTLMLLGGAVAVAGLGWSAAPVLAARIDTLADVDDGGSSRAERTFAALEPADLSRDVLQPVAPALYVSVLPPIGWSDWGTPERVLRDLDDRSYPGPAATVPLDAWSTAALRWADRSSAARPRAREGRTRALPRR